MKRFDYIRPSTVAEAVAAGSAPGSAYLAAGTNLLDLMKIGVATPDRVVDITRLPDLDGIERMADGSLRVGALVRNSDLARNPEILRDYPSVAEALLSGASPQLRNAATVGGNLMQKTRCAYFQDTASACNRREPGTGCDAKEGENRHHAILGWSDQCIATHPSDFCVALAGLDTLIEIEGVDGRRLMRFDEFHLLPGAAPERETALLPGDIVVAIRLPAGAAAFRAHSRYLKLRERTSFAFALVSVAASLEITDGGIRDARLTLGGVAAKPWRAHEAEALLIGGSADDTLFERAGEAAILQARPSGNNAAKIVLAKRLVTRALQMAAAGTPDHMPVLPASVFSPEKEVPAHV